MRLIVNGEAWSLHVLHHTRGFGARATHIWLHRGGCVLSEPGGEPVYCTSKPDGGATFTFPTNVLRRRAAFVHGHPVTIRERWSMPFSRAVGRREALTRLLLTMFPSLGPGDDKTSRAAFWAAYWTALPRGNALDTQRVRKEN